MVAFCCILLWRTVRFCKSERSLKNSFVYFLQKQPMVCLLYVPCSVPIYNLFFSLKRYKILGSSRSITSCLHSSTTGSSPALSSSSTATADLSAGSTAARSPAAGSTAADGNLPGAAGAAFCSIRLLVASTQAVNLIRKQGL